MKTFLGVGAMFPWEIDLTSDWNLKAGYFPENQTHPPSFLYALCCVVATAEMIMDMGNL